MHSTARLVAPHARFNGSVADRTPPESPPSPRSPRGPARRRPRRSTTWRERRQADRLGRLLADPAGRELLFGLTDEVLRTPTPDRSMAQLRALVEAGCPRCLPPLDRVALRLAAVGSRAGATAGGGDRAPADPGRDQRGHRPGRRPGVRPPRRRPPGRRVRRQRQPARRGHPRRRRGGRAPARRADRPHATARRRLRVGEDLGALRQPRRAGLRPRGRPHRRPPAHRLRRGRRAAGRCSSTSTWRSTGTSTSPSRPSAACSTSRPSTARRPGIVLQAYLPDTHAVLERARSTWAAARRRRGRRPIKVRLVKGANLAMEQVDAELGGWPPAPYATKADVDASYKALLDAAARARPSTATWSSASAATTCSTSPGRWRRGRLGVRDAVGVEMLEGMAPPQSAGRAAPTPAASCCTRRSSTDDDFAASIAYLSAAARRERRARELPARAVHDHGRLAGVGRRAGPVRGRRWRRRTRCRRRRAGRRTARTEQRPVRPRRPVRQRARHRLHRGRQPGLGRRAPRRPTARRTAADAGHDDGRRSTTLVAPRPGRAPPVWRPTPTQERRRGARTGSPR